MVTVKHDWKVITTHYHHDSSTYSNEYVVTRRCKICGHLEVKTFFAGTRSYDAKDLEAMFGGLEDPDAHRK